MEQNSEEWLQWRKIGSSDCPVILGISPYKTAFELYEEKLGLKEPKAASVAMQKGKETESYIRTEFEKQIGKKFSPACLVSDEYEFMTASLDGLSDNGEIFAEFKMNNEANHCMAKMGEIVNHHYAQVMHQWIVGKDHIKQGYYVSWHNGNLAIVEIELKTDYQQSIIQEEKAFWERLQNKTPPSLSDKDYLELEDQDLKELIDMYNVNAREEKKAAENKEKIKDLILERSGYRNIKIGDNKISKVIRAGNIDYSKVPCLKGINLDCYRKADVISWRIS